MKTFVRVKMFFSFLILATSITVVAGETKRAAAAGQKIYELQLNFQKTLDAVESKRGEIIAEAMSVIGSLKKQSSDEEFTPVLAALASAAAYDPGNETGQTAYLLMNKFGKARIEKLIKEVDGFGFLQLSIKAVSAEGRDTSK